MDDISFTGSMPLHSQANTSSDIALATEIKRSDSPVEACEQEQPSAINAAAISVPRLPLFRSRTMPPKPPHDLGVEVTMVEEINRLRSFQPIWDTKQGSVEKLSSYSTCGDDQQGSMDGFDGFGFPFFHLSSADFEWREHRFPFLHLDPRDFHTPRHWAILPFYDLDSKALAWEFRHKKKSNSPLDTLMEMVGLEEVKKEFLAVQERVREFQNRTKELRDQEAAKRNKGVSNKRGNSPKEGSSIRSLKLDLIISGTHGVGKSTIAKLYRSFLRYLGITDKNCKPRIIEEKEDDIEHLFARSGLDGISNTFGRRDSVDEETRRYYARYPVWESRREGARDRFFGVGSINANDRVLILEGGSSFVQRILSSPKASERFFKRLHISDYSEEDLLTIMVKLLKKNRLQVEGGYDAPFLRTFIRRIKQKKWKTFQNVKTLRDEFKKVLERRAERQEKATASQNAAGIMKISKGSFHLIESDFIGAKPDDFYARSEHWKQLDKMAGMEQIKDAVKELVMRRHINYARERAGKEPLKTTFNQVFLGPPGTGKTTVATLFGKIIADLGYLESNEVVIKKPSDFLGKYIGLSEVMTREILEKTKGKVLIIDEAHMLYHGGDKGEDKSDIFRKGIVDTIVANVDNEPGNNRCIILTGYKDRMREFYRNTNPGLQRRFPLDTAFVFSNYDDKTLGEIMDIMLAKEEITATKEAKKVAMEVLRRERDRPNFGNGGAVRNLLSRAQVTQSKRIMAQQKESPEQEGDLDAQEARLTQIVLAPQDFDPDHDRDIRGDKDFRSLFKDLVGFQEIIGTFESYQRMTANMKQRGLDPREEIPFSFIFKGPPGTGKTTTARALGEIYHSMGFLSTTEVMDCSVADLISGSGETGRKVQNLLERSLGKVLFIDEAYRMGQRDLSGAFISRLAQEAVGELVDCMTKEKFMGKLVIVLAGYGKEMDGLMSTNEGLRGRFTEMVFPSMTPKDCLRLLQKKLERRKISILHPGPSAKGSLQRVLGLFNKLCNTEAWANARDVETVAKNITRRVFGSDLSEEGTLDITLEEIALVLRDLYRQRKKTQSTSESS